MGREAGQSSSLYSLMTNVKLDGIPNSYKRKIRKSINSLLTVLIQFWTTYLTHNPSALHYESGSYFDFAVCCLLFSYWAIFFSIFPNFIYSSSEMNNAILHASVEPQTYPRPKPLLKPFLIREAREKKSEC